MSQKSLSSKVVSELDKLHEGQAVSGVGVAPALQSGAVLGIQERSVSAVSAGTACARPCAKPRKQDVMFVHLGIKLLLTNKDDGATVE